MANSNGRCERCAAFESRAHAAESALAQLRAELVEATKLIDLQKADLDRYKAAARIQPNTPERVDKDQLQLAFDRMIEGMQDLSAAKTLSDEVAAEKEAEEAEGDKPKGRKRHRHGRRSLDLTKLPVEDIVVDPDEVVAAGGEGYECIGEESSERVAFKRGGYTRLRITRRKWRKKDEPALALVPSDGAATKPSPISIAPLPESLWPLYMADPSAIAQHIIGKYGDCLSLNRQEGISARNGFVVPRSTQCGWLGAAHEVLYRIPDAMLVEAKERAFCIATDATGAPVRALKKCNLWHIFVFIADRDHVIFRYSEHHTSAAIDRMLAGFRGHVLADAAPIYDTLYRNGAIEVGCWFHLRRYFWSALQTEPNRALEALSLIARLFKIEKSCQSLDSVEHTATRARRAQPVLDLLDAWIARNRDAADPGGPLAAGIGYYLNQRLALHRFLGDGRLRLDNSISEQQLRHPILGRDNWLYYENETGLKWYTTFRSLIASCLLHEINPHDYLEQVLRLAPHWPVTRILELAPKYWNATVERLDDRQRSILVPPWERLWPSLDATAPPKKRVA